MGCDEVVLEFGAVSFENLVTTSAKQESVGWIELSGIPHMLANCNHFHCGITNISFKLEAREQFSSYISMLKSSRKLFVYDILRDLS